MGLHRSLPLALITSLVLASTLSLAPKVYANDLLPTFDADSARNTSGASKPPADLVSLNESLNNSVVTIQCGDSTGSAWAIEVDLPEAATDRGYRTYLVTNEHVVSNCLTGKRAEVLLKNGLVVQARVWAYDVEGDLAGLVMKSFLPGLTWRGQRPESGWWVGVIGSPLGLPGVFTDGRVSYVEKDRGTLTAAINPGNSGGPVFDNGGRVIGIATAQFEDSENFGIFHGTPMLCSSIVNCPTTEAVWSTSGGVPTSSSGIPARVFAIGIGILLVLGIALVVRSGSRGQRSGLSSPSLVRPSVPPGGSVPPPPPPPRS